MIGIGLWSNAMINLVRRQQDASKKQGFKYYNI